MSNFEIIWKGVWGAFVVLFSLLFLFAFGLLMAQAWWILLPIFAVICCGILVSYGIYYEPKKCVRCNERLKSQDESIYYKGSHEWCDTYY